MDNTIQDQLKKHQRHQSRQPLYFDLHPQQGLWRLVVACLPVCELAAR